MAGLAQIFDSQAGPAHAMLSAMRYPACWLSTLVLIAAPALAADAPASAPAVPAATPAPAAASAPAAAASPTPAADKPVPVTAPVDLFNGKDLTGWSYFVSGQPADITTAIQIKDGGVLAISKKPNGYLQVGPSRENYVLHVEWRWTIPNPPANTNSGALIHITPGALQQNIWPISFQFQMKVQRAGDIISMSTAQCAEAAAGKTANRQKDASEKPAGDWNSADITVRGDTITCTVNDVVQNTVTKCAPHSGFIGFQMEGYAYEMRNLKLSPLPAEKPAAPVASTKAN